VAGESAFVADPVSGRVQHTFGIASSDGFVAAQESAMFVSGVDQIAAYGPTGTPLWAIPEKSEPGGLGRRISLVDGTLYVSSNYTLYAFDPAHGTLRWQVDVPPELPKSDIDTSVGLAAVQGGLLATMVGTTDGANGFMVLDAPTGKVRWSFLTPGGGSIHWLAIPANGHIVASNGVVIYGFAA
jgi:outer membrane protein assembly factor BamB